MGDSYDFGSPIVFVLPIPVGASSFLSSFNIEFIKVDFPTPAGPKIRMLNVVDSWWKFKFKMEDFIFFSSRFWKFSWV